MPFHVFQKVFSILGIVVVFCGGIQNLYGTTIYNFTFENDTVGEIPVGWNLGSHPAAYVTDSVAAVGTKCVRLEDNVYIEQTTLNTSFPSCNSELYQLRGFSRAEQTNQIITPFDLQASGYYTPCSVGFWDDGTFHGGGTTGIPYQSGKWYEFIYDIDMSNKIWGYTIRDVEGNNLFSRSGLPTNYYGTNYFDKLRSFGVGAGGIGAWYIDDVSLVSVPEPSFLSMVFIAIVGLLCLYGHENIYSILRFTTTLFFSSGPPQTLPGIAAVAFFLCLGSEAIGAFISEDFSTDPVLEGRFTANGVDSSSFVYDYLDHSLTATIARGHNGSASYRSVGSPSLDENGNNSFATHFRIDSLNPAAAAYGCFGLTNYSDFYYGGGGVVFEFGYSGGYPFGYARVKTDVHSDYGAGIDLNVGTDYDLMGTYDPNTRILTVDVFNDGNLVGESTATFKTGYSFGTIYHIGIWGQGWIAGYPSNESMTLTVNSIAVPEPSSVVMIGIAAMGLLTCVWLCRNRRV
ncbi:MAG: PEP-CTERM sorting domain-containing protein [Pirellulales bacterium]|nr:PEP-CTERM sorting domain-containing protein [Pirellulales bacterium]